MQGETNVGENVNRSRQKQTKIRGMRIVCCLRQQSGRQASTPHKQSWHLHITCFFWTA